jgi:hypothetical protein
LQALKEGWFHVLQVWHLDPSDADHHQQAMEVSLGVSLRLSTAVQPLLQVPGQGRGLFAARPIPQGTDVLREQPLLCAPSSSLSHEVGAALRAAVIGTSLMPAWLANPWESVCGSSR